MGVTIPYGVLSIVIPVYNEAATLRQLVESVQAVSLAVDREIIVVDDCSTDTTPDVIAGLDVVSTRHSANRGKGAAVRTGLGMAHGEFVLIQDADLEYDPEDHVALLQPLLDGDADVVYGSRMLNRDARWLSVLQHSANRFLTWRTNRATGLELTDMETCYKCFRRSLLDRFELVSDDFRIEPELTIKLSRVTRRFVEIPIAYDPRVERDGKKLGWKDGFRALGAIRQFGGDDQPSTTIST